MAGLGDVAACFCLLYRGHLSMSRLVDLVYLADWRSALERGQQLTDVEWRFGRYGPFSDRFSDEIRRDSRFSVTPGESPSGLDDEVVRETRGNPAYSLSPQEEDIVRFVVARATTLSDDEFLLLVHSTYPLISQQRYQTLDLVHLASRYAQLRTAVAVS